MRYQVHTARLPKDPFFLLVEQRMLRDSFIKPGGAENCLRASEELREAQRA
jgi:hypothetical protein